MTMFFSRVARWLRVSLPEDLDQVGFEPLLVLFPRRLSDAEVIDLGRQLAAEGRGPAGRVDISVGMTKVTDVLPSAEEVDRVAIRLRDAGFAVEDPRLLGRPRDAR